MSAPPTPPVVELRDVHLSFDTKEVLRGVSVPVEPLDRLVVMGQSGSGKSTVLRLVLGILWPTSGSVFFKQFEISRLPRRKLQKIRTQIGMVYQYSALLSSMNVRDNVALPLEELTETFARRNRPASWMRSSNWSAWTASKTRCPTN